MEKAVIAPYSYERPLRRKPHPMLGVALGLGLWVACIYTGLFSAFLPKNGSVKVPINAQQIIQKCAHINTIPSAPLDFHSRDKSDRYVPGTKPTWIKNATIWTGNVDGFEVVLGDLLLDKGIIQAVGEIPAHILEAYHHHHATVIEANGAWVSPG